MRRLLGAFTAAAFLAGCSDGVSPFGDCSGPLAIAVGAGTKPVISWSPACGASSIKVVDTNAPDSWPLWEVLGAPGQITPPVTFMAPIGFPAAASGDSLVVGHSYRVYVGREFRGSGTARDSLTFTAH